MPCRSRRASISCLPRESFDRSRRPSGARAAPISGAGTTLAGTGFRRHCRFSDGLRLHLWRSRLGRTMLAQRLDLLCDAVPQRALLLAERALAPVAPPTNPALERYASLTGAVTTGMPVAPPSLTGSTWGRAAVMAPARPPPRATGFDAADPDVPDFAAAGPLAESSPVAAAGTSAGLAPFLTSFADRFAETVFAIFSDGRSSGTGSFLARMTGSRLFGTSITNRMLWRRRPDTLPASAPAPK